MTVQKMIAVFFSLFIMGINTNAQTINNLEVGKEYTLEQIKSALGEPTEVMSWEDESDIGYGYELSYSTDVFNFGNSGFSSFQLETNKFSVNGLFRVGDNISVLSTIPNSRLVLIEAGYYYLYLENNDDPIQISFESDKITCIWFIMSV